MPGEKAKKGIINLLKSTTPRMKTDENPAGL
jgi:hypothetical protein